MEDVRPDGDSAQETEPSDQAERDIGDAGHPHHDQCHHGVLLIRSAILSLT